MDLYNPVILTVKCFPSGLQAALSRSMAICSTAGNGKTGQVIISSLAGFHSVSLMDALAALTLAIIRTSFNYK